MANAILNGVIKSRKMKPDEVIISDIDEVKLKTHKENLGINITTDNNFLIDNSDYILFAVKPQIFNTISGVLKDIAPSQHIISIMAGIKIETILNAAEKSLPVCRVMPNTPCMIGEGMSVLCYYNYDEVSKGIVKAIFNSVGETIEMDEDKFDAVTSISGSGPAYIYSFIDAMVKGGIEGGLSEKDSRNLTVETMIGAAKMVKFNAEKPITDLIDAVCSKGGTTIEAIKSFREDNLEEVIVKGIRKCRLRSEELSVKK